LARAAGDAIMGAAPWKGGPAVDRSVLSRDVPIFRVVRGCRPGLTGRQPRFFQPASLGATRRGVSGKSLDTSVRNLSLYKIFRS
jgi:hypothetical protein